MKTKNKIRTALFLHADQMHTLETIRMIHGTPIAESVRRAIDLYFDEVGLSNREALARLAEHKKSLRK